MNNVALSIEDHEVPDVGAMLEKLLIGESMLSLEPWVEMSLTDPYGLFTLGYEMNGCEQIKLRIGDYTDIVQDELQITHFTPTIGAIGLRAVPRCFFNLMLEPKRKSYRGTPDGVLQLLAKEAGVLLDSEPLSPYRAWFHVGWRRSQFVRYLRDRAYVNHAGSGGVFTFGIHPKTLVAKHPKTLFSKAAPDHKFGGEDEPQILELNQIESVYGSAVARGFGAKGWWFDADSGDGKELEVGLGRPLTGRYWYIRADDPGDAQPVYLGRTTNRGVAEKAQASGAQQRRLIGLMHQDISVPFSLGIHVGQVVEISAMVGEARYGLASGRWLVEKVVHSLIPVPQTRLTLTRGGAGVVEQAHLHATS